MLINELIIPGKIVYGVGALLSIGSIVANIGKKVLIISDPIMEKLELVGKCEKYLCESLLSCVRYIGVGTEPTDIYVKEALKLCRDEHCDVIVAIGGGSCIDTAKAVGILATNEGALNRYLPGKQRFTNKPIPVVAVPTTAGTGSEVTKVTVITDTETDVKMMISDPMLIPEVAIIDPILTISCPPNITAATGIDALCHAIEAYISRKSQPITDMYALKAIDLISHNLKIAFLDGQNVEAREKVAMGSMLAGIAFSNSSVTLVHGMSRPIGALFHVPHGLSNAMLLPAVMEFVKDDCKEKMLKIGSIMNDAARSIEDTIYGINKLFRDLKIVNMKQWGIDRQQMEHKVNKMASDALDSGSPANTPAIPTHGEIVELYRKAFDYSF